MTSFGSHEEMSRVETVNEVGSETVLLLRGQHLSSGIFVDNGDRLKPSNDLKERRT